MEFVHSLGDAPKAIATGSAMPGASRTLAAAGLSGLFDVILTPDAVEHGKPAPDMFLKAAELLGASPDRCVVFEAVSYTHLMHTLSGEWGAITGRIRSNASGVSYPRRHLTVKAPGGNTSRSCLLYTSRCV